MRAAHVLPLLLFSPGQFTIPEPSLILALWYMLTKEGFWNVIAEIAALGNCQISWSISKLDLHEEIISSALLYAVVMRRSIFHFLSAFGFYNIWHTLAPTKSFHLRLLDLDFNACKANIAGHFPSSLGGFAFVADWYSFHQFTDFCDIL